ncbi:MAG TPA: glycosyl transferase [Desulfobulbaceae bacterium]|nr:glycosyl transferase [Desulfobulbaceae bacterium]
MLERITPVILTLNEEANIGRVLARLSWARTIVVVDSFSTDGTMEILSEFSNVKVFKRRFDSHAGQWNFAIGETGVQTPWVLALDADYVLTDGLVKELVALNPDSRVAGYRAGFRYCIFGKPLRGTLYPPVTVLYRREGARYIQDGHTQRIELPGSVEQLAAPILHDDRKPLSSWLWAQNRYMDLEAKVIKNKPWSALGKADKVRRLVVVAPALTFFYCLFVKGGVLDGYAGLYYAMQRSLAEVILSLKLIQARVGRIE